MVKLNKIYTRTGDAGTTGLVDGSRLPKHAPRMQAVGDVDEANSYFDAVKRDLNRLNDVVAELKDSVTELTIHMEHLCIEKAYAEHFWIREAHAEAIDARETTYQKLLKQTKEEENKEKDAKKKAKLTVKVHDGVDDHRAARRRLSAHTSPRQRSTTLSSGR